jgi:hypothetical protein
VSTPDNVLARVIGEGDRTSDKGANGGKGPVLSSTFNQLGAYHAAVNLSQLDSGLLVHLVRAPRVAL